MNAKLLEVVESDFADLTPFERAADTAYIENGEIKHYELPESGPCLKLHFKISDGFYNVKEFMTIRRSYPEKLKYYKATIFQLFKLVRTHE